MIVILLNLNKHYVKITGNLASRKQLIPVVSLRAHRPSCKITFYGKEV